MHDVADIDEAKTDAAADRRSDAGIGELEFGVVNQALIRCNGAIKLTNQCCLGIELLLRDDAFFKEQLITLKIDLGVLPLRLVFSKLSQSLLKLDLEGTRINLGEEISFVDKLTFLKRDAAELAIDATANRDGVEGGDRAKSIEIDGQMATLGSGNDNRHDQAACAAPPSALAGRPGRGGVCCRTGVPRVAVIPTTKSDNSKYQNPEPPTALGRHRGGSAARARFGKVYGLGLVHPFAPVMKAVPRENLPKAGQSQVDAGESCGFRHKQPTVNYGLRLDKTVLGGKWLRRAPGSQPWRPCGQTSIATVEILAICDVQKCPGE